MINASHNWVPTGFVKITLPVRGKKTQISFLSFFSVGVGKENRQNLTGICYLWQQLTSQSALHVNCGLVTVHTVCYLVCALQKIREVKEQITHRTAN